MASRGNDSRHESGDSSRYSLGARYEAFFNVPSTDDEDEAGDTSNAGSSSSVSSSSTADSTPSSLRSADGTPRVDANDTGQTSVLDTAFSSKDCSSNNNNNNSANDASIELVAQKQRQPASGSFDPFAVENAPSDASASPVVLPPRIESVINVKGNSLLDDQTSVATQDTNATTHTVPLDQSTAQNSTCPGTAGYLEIEEAPSRSGLGRSAASDGTHHKFNRSSVFRSTASFVNDGSEEPIKTSSGLLLTHRRSPTVKTNSRNSRTPAQSNRSRPSYPSHTLQYGEDATDTYDNAKAKNNASFHSRLSHSFLGQSTPPTGRTGPLDTVHRTSDNNHNRDYFEVEHGRSWTRSHARPPNSGPIVALQRARRMLSFVRLWMVACAIVLITFTGVFMHSFGHRDSNNSKALDESGSAIQISDQTVSQQQQQQQQQQQNGQILLLPLPHEDISQLGQQGQSQSLQQGSGGYRMTAPFTDHNSNNENNMKHNRIHHLNNNNNNRHNNHQEHHGQHRVLLEMNELRHKFEHWIHRHGKSYHSDAEKEHRFHIWSQNHHRTQEKNARHGKCRLTNQEVFGSNGLQDLTQEEFKARYLTGYRGLMGDDWKHHQRRHAIGPSTRRLSHGSGKVMDPSTHRSIFHPSVRQRMLAKKNNRNSDVMSASSSNCKWYDISCWIRWVFYSTGIGFGIGTMEPVYDADSYPIAVDWRDYGAITDVKSQGECGACWAITAVETIEAATFLSTGELYDLAETEVIVCDDTCEMCSGGWPQNAFEWVMEHNGLLLEDDMVYDDEFLLALTEGMEGTSATYTADNVAAYAQSICPADGSSHDSKDGNDGNDNEDGQTKQRYGQIKGYGYATDRCLCYTDGSGCSCDTQDEALAVRNVASYGPATVCLEASLWQDYAGGIITSDLGCTSAFLDMNHCVQVVGYAFNQGSDQNDRDLSSNSHSGSGSRDDGDREGYWIVRNQWGSNWGMNGYAYVAMGDNTCGILNDMTQVYTDNK